MKTFIAFICLLFSISIFGQYTPQEIKKYKISKIIKYSANADSSETQKQEKLYDRYGNDTATYLDDQLYMHSTYEYNSKGQTLKRITYDFDGKETETAIYTYKPDGSYSISNTDKQFEMTDYTYYDKTGRTIKTRSPDGSEKLYSYSPQGRLLKIKTKLGGNGLLVDIQYTYNTKGQLIKEVNKGEYKWAKTYSYDAKGLLKKSINISYDDGMEKKSPDSYEYEFWK